MTTPPPAEPTDDEGRPPEPSSPAPPPPPSPPASASTYGTPQSPWYGKFGQGEPARAAVPATTDESTAPTTAAPARQPGWGEAGYRGPQAPPRPGAPQRLVPVGGLRSPVIAASLILGIALIANSYLTPNQNETITSALEGVRVSTQPGSRAYQIFSSVTLLVQIGAWVLSCLWLTKVRQNAVVLRPDGQRRSEIWVWLAWIVPVVNLWFPKQIVDDAVTATSDRAGVPARSFRTGLWWTAWVTSSVLGVAIAVASLLPPETRVQPVLATVQAVAVVTGVVLWVRIVQRLSDLQDRMAAQAGTS